jgi:hypothetical protein
LKKLFIFPALIYVLSASAQSDWKQSLHYELRAKFNPTDKSLDALMKLRYTNHSPDTISFIWFHVWPNAYRNDKTLYSEQLLENGDTHFYFSSKEQKGYLNRLDFRVDGVLSVIQDHAEHIDIVKLILPKPLLPGDSLIINASFHLRLPYNFNGNGYRAQHYEWRNWYPEPAVYDARGWHPMPMLVQGGAFHEAADFEVEIETPLPYEIAASAAADNLTTTSESNLYHFSIKNANAFAWIADNHFLVKKDSLELPGGRMLSLLYFYTSSRSDHSKQIFASAKNGIRQLSAWMGPYPYQTLSILETTPMPDQDFSGLICIGQNKKEAVRNAMLRKALIAQWFQTVLLTDQRGQPWLSKGFMEYYYQRLISPIPPTNQHKPAFSNKNLWLRVAENEKTTQPISSAAPVFSLENDSIIASKKAGYWVGRLQDEMGRDRFDKNMRLYFSQWQFKHPNTENLKKLLDSGAGKNLQALFKELSENKPMVPQYGRTVKPTFIFSARNSERINYIGLAPLPGYNRYDGFMLGALVHNINLPENKFEFLFTPFYAFDSKSLVGLGRLSYSWHPENHFSRIRIGVNGAHFDSNKATDSTGNLLFENFSKLVPYIRVDFKPSNPRATIRKWMDFKTFLITEQTYDIESYAVSSKDSLTHPNAVSSHFRYVNQLSFNLRDDRALYPYDLRAEFQQAELFYRINLKANYFMNYTDGGGLQVRLFAAKFGVWNPNNHTDVSRYEPKLLGVNGEEDYLYEDYFVGRSASYAVENSSVPKAGIDAQQIMNRDGGLKLRIDQYDYVQGKSANWVSALNFNTSLPAHLFPFPVPLRIFFDVGTYSEAWQDNSPTSRFLYVGGIQFSLFHNVLNIYAPLFYSSDFKDVLIGTDFGRRVTFSIDIQNINYKKTIRRAAGS